MAARERLQTEPSLENELIDAPSSNRSGIREKQTEPSLLEPSALEPQIFGMTAQGLVRATNQDQFLVADLSRSITTLQGSLPAHSGEVQALQGRLLVVADGMGGYEGGDLASAIAVDTFATFVVEIMPWLVASAAELREHVLDTLRMGVHGADAAVYRAAMELGLDERLGTTLTAVYVTWPEAYIAHVGDSRCYLHRDGELTRLTTDHTVAQELLEAEAINDDQAKRTQLRHVLVNTVGGVREKQLMVEVQAFELREHDELLLCTDGLTGHLSDPELYAALAQRDSVEQRVRSLVELAYDRGANDNLTAILASF
jgi:serine/threonine protein phosphatase PrpC